MDRMDLMYSEHVLWLSVRSTGSMQFTSITMQIKWHHKVLFEQNYSAELVHGKLAAPKLARELATPKIRRE